MINPSKFALIPHSEDLQKSLNAYRQLRSEFLNKRNWKKDSRKLFGFHFGGRREDEKKKINLQTS